MSNIKKKESVKSISTDRCDVSLILKGNPGPGDWLLLLIFNGKVLLEIKWQEKLDLLNVISLPLNLKEPYYLSLIADQPLIIMLQSTGGKALKEQDPLLNAGNKAGSAVNLFPLALGEKKINIEVPLISLQTGENINCYVAVYILQTEEAIIEDTIPLTLTMLSAHCLPAMKDGTVCICAMEVTNIHKPPKVNFGMSLSDSTAKNIVWASVNQAGQAANTSINCPCDDKFVPADLLLKTTENCKSVYWNSMRRILVDPTDLRNRLESHFAIDIAVVPRQGKLEVRGRYMAFVDARVLLEARQFGVTICVQLLPFNETNFPEGIGSILEIPPTSAKSTAREPYLITDEFGHTPYIVIRFDLCQPLTPKIKTIRHYETIGYSPSDGPLASIFELDYMQVPHDNKQLDAKCIRTEAGALAVHEELSKLVPGGTIQTKQSKKRTQVNILLQNIRLTLKQFSLDKIDNWQDIVSSQHRASIRSVQASFAPQTRLPNLTSQFAAGKANLAGDTRIATNHIETNLNIAPTHPRVLFSKALHCLEDRRDIEAREYLLRSLNSQPRNRYVLWTLGGMDFNRYDRRVTADAAFHIAVKKDVSDGITGTIGWAALHTLNHFWQDSYAAFVTAKKMRKCFELEKAWKQFVERWRNVSGEEEIYWDPSIISANDPFLYASAFFLCLRCFDMCEKFLQCFENGCSTRGSRLGLSLVITPDIYYIRIASLLLRERVSDGLKLTEDGLRKFGPAAILLQIRSTCLVLLKGWGSDCNSALKEAERAGAKTCSFLLYQAAVGNLNENPEAALQYAAGAYTNNPSAFIALLIAQIYAKIGEEYVAERWAAVAVNEEPLLADGWAFLAILAMREQNIAKARAMLRTAKQAGPLSSDIQKQVKKMMKIIKIGTLSYSMTENICFCEYY